MKIAILSPILQPYRISFYEKLNLLFPGTAVFYGYSEIETGRPGYTKSTSFLSFGFEEKKFIVFKFGIIYLKGLYSSVVQYNPDVVICQGIPGNISFRLISNWVLRNKKCLVFWYCGWEPNIKRLSLFSKFKLFLANRFYRKGKFFLVYSTKAKMELISRGYDSSLIEVAYNGIELDDYTNIEKFKNASSNLLDELNKSNDKIYLYVGGLLEEKRVLFLIEAFNLFSKDCNDCQLWIIGDGPQKDDVLKLIDGKGNFKFFGRIVDGVEAFFLAADFYVLPGTGGLGLNQALFFGSVPICGAADGTEDDLVLDGLSGFRFIRDNIDSLVLSLKRSYFASEDVLSDFKIYGKKIIVERSNVNNMVEVFYKNLSKL